MNLQIHNLKSSQKNGTQSVAITLGVFDGVHLGHQDLVIRTVSLARKHGIQAGVLILYPSPDQYFNPNHPTELLTTLEERISLLEKFDLDVIAVLEFDSTIASMTAVEFLEKVLISQLSAKALVFGHDLSIGKDRMGDFRFFSGLKFEGLILDQVKARTDSLGSVICSTQLRKYIREGKIKEANENLGRRFVTLSQVISGQKIGSAIGIPTLNLAPPVTAIPERGVYLAWSRWAGDNITRYSLVNVGYRPTVHDSYENMVIEVYQLNHSPTLLAQPADTVRIEWLEKIRDEVKFSSVDELRSQISRDIELALSKYHQFNVV